MWLVITAAAAIITTVIWYVKAPEDKYKLGVLSWIFWGATLMWLVDHVMAYIDERGDFLEISFDAIMLGLAVVVLGLGVWAIVLLVSDPKGVLRRALKK
jgi:hypothetical protein